jgi:universal stress protein E
MCDYNDYLEAAEHLDEASLQKARQDYVTRKRAWLSTVAASLGAASIPLSVKLEWGRPLHEGITRHVLQYEPDLVLKDTHHHRVIERGIFTNTDWHLIRECPAPLLLVRSGDWPEKPVVLAAVDPMHENDKPARLDHRILDTAEFMTHAVEGELHVVHVYAPMETITSIEGVAMLPLRQINDDIEAKHRQALAGLVEGRGIPANRVHLRVGDRRNEVREAARRLHANLIVMGAVSRSGLRRVFLGSTAEQLLETMPCDVLVVKDEGFMSPVEPAGEFDGVAG